MSDNNIKPDGEFYWRYFRVTDPEFDQKMRDLQARHQEVGQQWSGLCRSLNASNIRTWTHTGEFAGFVFDTEPDNSLFKKVGDLWVPKKSTKAGKDLWKLINEIPSIITNHNSVLGDYGLEWKKPMDFDIQEGQAYYATVSGFYEPGIWFVKVPSRHFCAATLEAAAQIKEDTGSAGSTVLENALWQPPAAFVQVKQWEFIREWDELSEKFS